VPKVHQVAATKNHMLGAIAGDVVGSIYESVPTKSPSFPLFAPESRFTDDTVLTIATAWESTTA
jgi:ADP-ribosylglycohydrolase